MADYGLLGGLAEGLKQGLLSYRDTKKQMAEEEDKKAERERRARTDAISAMREKRLEQLLEAKDSTTNGALKDYRMKLDPATGEIMRSSNGAPLFEPRPAKDKANDFGRTDVNEARAKMIQDQIDHPEKYRKGQKVLSDEEKNLLDAKTSYYDSRANPTPKPVPPPRVLDPSQIDLNKARAEALRNPRPSKTLDPSQVGVNNSRSGLLNAEAALAKDKIDHPERYTGGGKLRQPPTQDELMAKMGLQSQLDENGQPIPGKYQPKQKTGLTHEELMHKFGGDHPIVDQNGKTLGWVSDSVDPVGGLTPDQKRLKAMGYHEEYDQDGKWTGKILPNATKGGAKTLDPSQVSLNNARAAEANAQAAKLGGSTNPQATPTPLQKLKGIPPGFGPKLDKNGQIQLDKDGNPLLVEKPGGKGLVKGGMSEYQGSRLKLQQQNMATRIARQAMNDPIIVKKTQSLMGMAASRSLLDKKTVTYQNVNETQRQFLSALSNAAAATDNAVEQQKYETLFGTLSKNWQKYTGHATGAVPHDILKTVQADMDNVINEFSHDREQRAIDIAGVQGLAAGDNPYLSKALGTWVKQQKFKPKKLPSDYYKGASGGGPDVGTVKSYKGKKYRFKGGANIRSNWEEL